MPSYKHCPKCSNNLHIIKGIFGQCSACAFIFYPTIKLTASIILENEKGEILLLRRNRSPHRGSWNTPGGHIDAGETAEQAAHREIKEETGLKISKLEFCGSYTDTYKDQGITYPLLAISFCGRTDSSQRIKAGDDASAHKYFGPKKIPWQKIGFKSDVRALKDYLKRRNLA